MPRAARPPLAAVRLPTTSVAAAAAPPSLSPARRRLQSHATSATVAALLRAVTARWVASLRSLDEPAQLVAASGLQARDDC